MSDLPSGTVTFLFTDIEGSTRLWEQHSEAMRHVLTRHDVLLRQAIERHNGHVFKTIGDAFYAAFSTASEALGAALSAQQALQAEARGAGRPLQVRMALHTGAVEHRDSDYFGQPLNRIARLLSIGHGGQVLLSLATEELVRDVLPEGVYLHDLGPHRLRDLTRPEQVFLLLHPDLPADFPPLKSLDSLPNNLSRQLTGFIGRAKEIAEVRGLLAKTRLLTLTGSGGCGKTRLALQVAVEVLEEYPDGVWVVELAPLSASSLAPQAVASVLNVHEEPGRSMLQTLIDSLKTKQVLLFLDNCEHLIAACATLSETLLRTCPRVKILVTSREGLGIAGETTYRVPSLTLPDLKSTLTPERLSQYEAAHLFLDRATEAVPEFAFTAANTGDVAQICCMLDGIPFAIELAAAWVRVLPVEQIARRLEDRLSLLLGGSRTSASRHQTLRATLDWSYDLLSEPEKQLFCVLSVFAGGWTLEAAEAVCAAESQTSTSVLNLLAQLVDKSLVEYVEQQGQARYRLLETTRQYAREKLEQRGVEQAAQPRHRSLAWFLNLAELARNEIRGHESHLWLERTGVEQANFRQLLDWTPTRLELVESGLRMIDALSEIWVMRGAIREAGERLDAHLQQAQHVEASMRARACCHLGDIRECLQEDEAAERCYQKALALSADDGDIQSVSARIGLGRLARKRGAYEQACAWFTQNLTILRAHGDRGGLAYQLNELGLVLSAQGEHARASAVHEESLSLWRELQDKHGIAFALHLCGKAALAQDDEEAARRYHRESLPLLQDLDNRSILSYALEEFAWLAARKGQVPSAIVLYAAGAALRESIGVTLPTTDLPVWQARLADLRSATTPELFLASWEQGRSMPLEEAIAYALQIDLRKSGSLPS
jgi:predicted ATPase/class 3 adenylate cyclase